MATYGELVLMCVLAAASDTNTRRLQLPSAVAWLPRVARVEFVAHGWCFWKRLGGEVCFLYSGSTTLALVGHNGLVTAREQQLIKYISG
jgi:hypothetical protein